ncbi:hypothetical protein A2U01_0051439 [Trifolium medium]|uniref:Uncharacterized protein n=1 Tax=Trifolium medium TaxID=97028 RepID=A0A392R312_9FABA|nr:hypothetical protein [Trifolium medium]
MKEGGTNRETCDSSNGCRNQVKVGVKVKIRVGLVFDLVSWTVVQVDVSTVVGGKLAPPSI